MCTARVIRTSKWLERLSLSLALVVPWVALGLLLWFAPISPAKAQTWTGTQTAAQLDALPWNTQKPVQGTYSGGGSVIYANPNTIAAQATARGYTGASSSTFIDLVNRTTKVSIGETLPSPRTASTVPVNVERLIPHRAVARAIARSLPIIGTALTIKELLDAVRCREKFGGGAECDDGTPTTTQTIYKWTCGPGMQPNCFSPAQACQSFTPPQTVAYCTYAENGTCLSYMCTGSIGPVTRSGTTGQACPAATIGGHSFGPGELQPGVDGKCPTGAYTPEELPEVERKLWDHSTPAAVAGALPSLLGQGVPVLHGFPSPQPGQAIEPSRQTTTAPDGSVTVRDTSYEPKPTADGLVYEPKIVEKTFPPGATIPPVGTIGDGTTTTGQTPSTVEIITCGLPGTPPCKIDEGGTPPPNDPGILGDPGQQMGPDSMPFENPPVADTSWSWSFSLPSSCGPIATPAFAPWITEIDVCPYQPMIHDIMSLVWIAATIFASVGMVYRAFIGG